MQKTVFGQKNLVQKIVVQKFVDSMVQKTVLKKTVCVEIQVLHECSSHHQHTPHERFTQQHHREHHTEHCYNLYCPYVHFNVQNEQHPEEYLKEQNDEVCSSEQFYQGISGPKEKLQAVNNNNDNFSLDSKYHPYVCSSYLSLQRCPQNQQSPERRT